MSSNATSAAVDFFLTRRPSHSFGKVFLLSAADENTLAHSLIWRILVPTSPCSIISGGEQFASANLLVLCARLKILNIKHRRKERMERPMERAATLGTLGRVRGPLWSARKKKKIRKMQFRCRLRALYPGYIDNPDRCTYTVGGIENAYRAAFPYSLARHNSAGKQSSDKHEDPWSNRIVDVFNTIDWSQ